MATGDLTVTLVGSYDTMVAAIVGLDAGNDALVTDSHQLFIEPGKGAGRYKVIKYVRAAS